MWSECEYFIHDLAAALLLSRALLAGHPATPIKDRTVPLSGSWMMALCNTTMFPIPSGNFPVYYEASNWVSGAIVADGRWSVQWISELTVCRNKTVGIDRGGAQLHNATTEWGRHSQPVDKSQKIFWHPMRESSPRWTPSPARSAIPAPQQRNCSIVFSAQPYQCFSQLFKFETFRNCGKENRTLFSGKFAVLPRTVSISLDIVSAQLRGSVAIVILQNCDSLSSSSSLTHSFNFLVLGSVCCEAANELMTKNLHIWCSFKAKHNCKIYSNSTEFLHRYIESSWDSASYCGSGKSFGIKIKLNEILCKFLQSTNWSWRPRSRSQLGHNRSRS